MSVADKLGTGSSFGSVPRGRSARGRAKAVAQGDVPTYELVRLHLDEVSPTPLNPRRNFGSDEDKTRFGEELRQAQLAACVAVTRDAYLALWPDHAPKIGSAQHVLVNGERRYHSAVHVGLEALDFVVRDDLASSREEFINHLLKENLEREDFDVIERARGIQELVEVCAEKSERGARARAAERLGKDRSWVTNQLALLELPPEIQAMLSSGDLPERDGRVLARHCKENPGLDAAELIEYLKSMKALESQAKAQEKAVLQAVREGSTPAPKGSLLSADNKQGQPEAAAGEIATPQSLLSADNKPSDSPPPSPDPSAERSDSATEPPLLSADNKAHKASADPAAAPATPPQPDQATKRLEPEQSAGDAIPEPRRTQPGPEDTGRQPRKLPYDDAFSVVTHLHLKMEPTVFAEGARVWLRILREQHPDAYSALLQELTQQEQPA